MEQLGDDLLQQRPDQRRLGGGEVQIVDEQHEDATGGVGPRRRPRQDDAFRRISGGEIGGRQHVEDAAAVHHDQRCDLLRDAVFEHLEVVLAEVGHELAALDVRGITSRVTRSTPERNVGCDAGGGGGWPTAAAASEMTIAASTNVRAAERSPACRMRVSIAIPNAIDVFPERDRCRAGA